MSWETKINTKLRPISCIWYFREIFWHVLQRFFPTAIFMPDQTFYIIGELHAQWIYYALSSLQHSAKAMFSKFLSNWFSNLSRTLERVLNYKIHKMTFYDILWHMPDDIEWHELCQYGYQKKRIDQTKWSRWLRISLQEQNIEKFPKN